MISLKTNKNYIWVYFIIFYVLWCIRELWLVQYLDMMNSIPRGITSAIIKIAIWVIPVMFLVKIMEKGNPLSNLGLRHHFKKGLKWVGWVSFVFILYLIFNLTVLKNDINFQIGFNDWLNTILLVGITEEIVFRGFLLRKLMDTYKFWIANIMTSLLFVIIHFPIWLYDGLFEFPYIVSAIVQVFLLSIGFGFVYKKTSSLWSVIMIHSLYNLVVSLFY